MTRLTYLSEAAIPSRSSNATATVRMCGAFADAGADVTLVYPRLQQPEPEGFAGDVAAFYGIADAIERRVLHVPHAKGRSPLQRIARSRPFAAYLGGRMRGGQPSFICYTRTFQLAWLALQVRRAWGRRGACRALIMEVHGEPPKRGWSLLSSVDGVVVISEMLRQRILERLPQLEGRVWVEHSGVDLSAVHRGADRAEARARIGCADAAGPLVVYAGRVFKGKGVDVLIEAAERVSDIGARVLVVGNVYEDEYVSRAPDNVTFTGFVAPSEVPDYLAAADMMVMPTTESLHYSRYTSPLKLFEYLATGNPVVVSDLPVLREVVRDGENALLYPPRDADALAGALRRLWSDRALGVKLADQAWQDVQQYSWQRRAQRILERVDGLADAGAR
ncbi:MAG TPA: glycosyltransferase family 4 protein [Solirubrobacteraceae bacterium]|nr:glycosyltransferase family 4 protein [Solirubrobacteraceae bacterium]